MPGGEDQAGIGPAISRTVPGCVLLLAADLQSGYAQVRKGKGCLGCLGLDLAVYELAANTLELLAHVQLGGVEVDLVPGETEDFTLAQAEDEDQDECGVERFASVPG